MNKPPISPPIKPKIGTWMIIKAAYSEGETYAIMNPYVIMYISPHTNPKIANIFAKDHGSIFTNFTFLFTISFFTSFSCDILHLFLFFTNYFVCFNIFGDKKPSNYLVNSNPIIDIQINNIGHITNIKIINKIPIGLIFIKSPKVGAAENVSKTPEPVNKAIKPTISPITHKILKPNLFLADISIQSLIFNRISLNIKLIILYVFLPFWRFY